MLCIDKYILDMQMREIVKEGLYKISTIILPRKITVLNRKVEIEFIKIVDDFDRAV